MKRSLIRLMAMVIVIATALALCVPAMASSVKYIRTTGTCYIRSEPDKSSESYRTASKGEVFAYDETATDSRGVLWYGIEYGSKGTAWISSKNCKKISESEAKGSSTKTSTKYIRTTGSCNVRSEPDKSSKSYGTASKGQVFAYDQTSTDSRGVLWYGVVYGSKGTAWISSKYAEKISKSEAKATATPKVTATPKATATPKPIDYSKFTAVDQYMVVTGGSVNLRKEPSADRKSLGTYPQGYVLHATATDGKWYQVVDEEKDVTGYMSGDYLEVTEIGGEEEEAVESFAALLALADNFTPVDAPAGATNVTYTFINDEDLQIAEIAFDYEGASFVLSAAFAFGTENVFEDMGDELTLMDVAYISDDGTLASVYHFDEENSTQYRLTGPAIMNGSVVTALTETLFAA